MQIASALFDLAPDAGSFAPPRTWDPVPPPRPTELVRAAVIDQIQHPVEAVLHAAEAPARVADLVSRTASGVRAIVGMGRTPTGPFDAAIGPNRRFATTDAPFERFHRVKAALGGTINDVVLTTVAGGLHEVLRSRGEPTRGRSLRVMVPVSVRGEDDPQLGNRVAPAFVDVPVGAMRPERRLRAVRKATAALKASSMAESAESIIELGAFAPPALHAAAARLASRGRWFNLVVSNVPAPQVPLYLSGARLVASYPSIPLNGNVALSIACTSLGGTMAFGLTADWDAVPDLDVLIRGIDGALDQLEKSAADRDD
jgi:WS/DGAT/MGAT family acyltransferase